MPTWPEIVRSVEAAWLLSRGDRGAMARFDLSVDGFWQSFTAALVVAPAYLFVLLDQYRQIGWPDDAWSAGAAETLSYVVSWLALPLAAIPLTRVLGLTARYVPLVIAGNWATVIQVAVYTGAVAFGLLAPGEPRTLALYIATILVLVNQWFVIRTALATTGMTAFGFVLADLVLNVACDRVLDRVFES